MSRPFDDTSEWWRNELRQIAQIVHQAHVDEDGSWRYCPKASCTRFRDVLEASMSSTDTKDIAPEDIVFVRTRRSRE